MACFFSSHCLASGGRRGPGGGRPRGPAGRGAPPAWVQPGLGLGTWFPEPGKNKQIYSTKMNGRLWGKCIGLQFQAVSTVWRASGAPPAGAWGRPVQLDQQPGSQELRKNDRVQNEWKSMGTAVPGVSTGGRATSGARGPRENRSRSSRGTPGRMGGWRWKPPDWAAVAGHRPWRVCELQGGRGVVAGWVAGGGSPLTGLQ